MTHPTPPTLIDHLHTLQRRRWAAITAGTVILIVAIASAFLWPATYRAAGTILIEQQELPTDLVRSTISSYADQRIQVITQRVMTTENLFRIIQKYDLYTDARQRKAREVIMQTMREDIGFDMISADVVDPRLGRPTKATIAFAVSFQHRNPVVAAKVANELVNLYLQENLESRKQRTTDATTFLTAEAERLNATIGKLSEQLADFKEANASDLPELTAINIQLMNAADIEVRDIDTRVRSLGQQVVYLDSQLAQLNPVSQVYTATGERMLSSSDRLKYLRTEYARAQAIYAPTHPDVMRLKSEIAGLERTVGSTLTFNELDRQRQDARSQLDAARQKYGVDHPDILQLEALVRGLEEQLRTSERADPSVSPANETPDNPAYIQVKAQREATVSEREALLGKRTEVKARQRTLEERLAKTPAVEREYSVLLRDLENTRAKYQEVRQKQMEAELAQNMEEDRKGERFTLIEPPIAPQQPASPNRLAILLLGLALSLGGAVGIVVLREMLDANVRHRRDVEMLLSVPPLTVLPWIETQSERAVRTRMRRLSFAGGAATLVMSVAFVHLFYRPLDVLWEVALRRFFG